MRSRRTRRILLATATLCAAALLAACGPDPAPPPPPPPATHSAVATDIISRHNYIRGLDGLSTLQADGGVQANAQFHADRLAAAATSCSGALWHTPNAELSAWYPGQSAGENLACVPGCPTSGQQPFDMWMKSGGHYANIVRPNFNYIGMGIKCTGSVMIVVGQYRSG